MSQAHVRARKELFWGVLRAKQGQKIPLADLAAINKLVFGQKISDGTCRGTLQHMQDDPCPFPGGRIVEIARTTVLFTCIATVFDNRELQRPRIKSLLGEVVWNILLGDIFKQVHYDKSAIKRSTIDKIADLRRKSLVTALIDAGSSTIAVARKFNLLPRVPLAITLGSGEDRHRHLLRVNFVSNSIALLSELSRGPHRDDINLTVVGGEIRGQRASICGLSTQVFLEECATGGDVAIIGTTGYGGMNGDRRCFFSDHLEEARLKIGFLERATLRILLFDSSKLECGSPTRAFADLSHDCIDLIVTDDGSEKDGAERNYVEEVATLLEQAHQNGVSVAILKPTKKISENEEELDGKQ